MLKIYAKFRRLSLLLCVFWSPWFQAGAAPGGTQIKLPMESISPSRERAGPPQTQLDGEVKVEGTQYASPSASNPKLNQTQSIIANLRLQKSGSTEAVVDLMASDNLSVGTAHFGIAEAYFAIPWGSQGYGKASLGRKLEKWSQIDQDWQLGQWQPTYGQVDVLRPMDQGLTGLFLNLGQGSHDLLLFATPVFIPSMGPEVKEKNGSIETDSRWYRSPSPTFNWRGVVTQVVYSFDIPDIAKLIGNAGAGLRYRWGGSKGPFAAFNYGYKPINSLILKYRTLLRTPEVGQRGEVTVMPAVDYHQIGGADFGYAFDRSLFAVSALSDRPEPKGTEENWFQQQPEPFQAISLHADVEMDFWDFNYPLAVSFQYLKVFGGKIHDTDSSGENMGALFENRFNFNNAASVRLQAKTSVWHKQLISSFKYLRDFQQRGALFSFESSLYLKKYWSLSAGLDVLGVDNESNQEGTFLNQFRANDRFYGGLSYLF